MIWCESRKWCVYIILWVPGWQCFVGMLLPNSTQPTVEQVCMDCACRPFIDTHACMSGVCCSSSWWDLIKVSLLELYRMVRWLCQDVELGAKNERKQSRPYRIQALDFKGTQVRCWNCFGSGEEQACSEVRDRICCLQLLWHQRIRFHRVTVMNFLSLRINLQLLFDLSH